MLKQVSRRNKTEGQGTYAVGRLVVADGKFSPPDVMFQVPLTAEGYFATEIGDPSGSLAFRAPGYNNLDVPLTAADADEEASDGQAPAIVLGDVTMQPLGADQAATLHGRVAPDDAEKAKSAEVTLSLGMGPSNTPHGGYSPRKGWPEPMTVEVNEDGTFDVSGLNPSEYSVSITADDHAALRKSITLEPGEKHDAGELTLRSTDLGFYIGAEKPDVPELAWEKDFDTALERAKTENRPLFVMMTATWCGPCKMLERDSLSNIWIRKFLEPFVVVQAFEVDEVEKKYGLQGYPTLVFADSSGKKRFKSVGYQPAIDFAATVAKGLTAVEQEMPAELQTLIDKEIITVEEPDETADEG
jgi:thiol-disulfide isomerase/thioredoxin